MEEHIGFFKKIILSIILLLSLSCSSKNQIRTIDEYYNFEFNTFEYLNFIQYESKIKLNSKINSEITYFAKLRKNKGENNVIDSYFIFNGNIYKTPLNFKNSKSYTFKYSLMPKYSEKNLVAKKFNYNKFSVLIIRGENPFCNGNYCKNYYLHLLIIKDRVIKLNSVYQLNYDDVRFEEFNVSLNNNDVLLLMNKNKTIDKLKVILK